MTNPPGRRPTPQDRRMQTFPPPHSTLAFGDFSGQDAVGVMLAHSLTAGAQRFRKGHVLSAEDVALLHAAGIATVSGARLAADDLAENPAAEQVAALLAGPNTQARVASGGRSNLHATAAGIVVIDAERIVRANLVDEAVAIGTLPPWTPVRKGQVIATVKIIPCGVARRIVADCRTILATPPLRIAELQPRRIALIVTELPGIREKTLAATITVTQQRLATFGSRLALELRCPHEATAIAAAVREAHAAGCEIILISGAAGTKDRRDVAPSAIVAAGGRIERFGMPVEPGNMLLLARLGSAPLLVLPGCARSRRLNGLDWVLQRLLADLPLDAADFAAMGVGGLIRQTPGAFPEPAEEAESDDAADARSDAAPIDNEPRAERPPRIAALVLAAGQSRRMGSRHKLLERIDGIPLVRRAVNAALASRAASVTVVTGSRAEEIGALVAAPRVTLAHNPDYAEGMASSLRRGIAALPADADAVLVLLADMPRIDAGHLDRLIEAYAERADQAPIVVPTHAGRRGNPVLWPHRHFAEMTALAGDQGARALLDRHATEIQCVEMPDTAIFNDIDTREDLES